MKLILKSQLNTDGIIQQMRNKQLDKFAFMVVLLFHRFNFECFIRAVALIMWCWELFFGFSVTLIELDVIALRWGKSRCKCEIYEQCCSYQRCGCMAF
jgi:uncharacterized protein YgfB (UPF0149 family)